MTYFPDLSPCTYFDHSQVWSDQLTAVGWLDAMHPFQRGPTDAQVVARLVALVEEPWESDLAVGFLGSHACELCPTAAEMRSTEVVVGDLRFTVGSTNLYVPGETSLYVAPSLILHYILVHEYQPPIAFCRSVVACPRASSRAYHNAICRTGPSEWRAYLGEEKRGWIGQWLHKLFYRSR